MKLELPLIVLHHSPRLVEAWLPRLGLQAKGPSLAELRDELALQVMVQFEREPSSRWRLYQMPPHMRLVQVHVQTVARDRERGLKYELDARLGVLLEKWPADEFWVAMPTRIEAAAFALDDPDSLEPALARQLGAYCLQHGIETLEAYETARRERLDVLEVDADPPSILPRTLRPSAARRRRPPRGGGAGAGGEAAARAAAAKAEENPETPAEREERRRRRRLSARTLREVGKNLSYGAEDDTLERTFGREALVELVTDELHGHDGVALVLVGPPSAGKTALVHEVTRRLRQRYQAAGLRRDVWRVDGGRFISGQSFVGQWERRARALADELAGTGDILFADDLASLIYAGRTRDTSTCLAGYLEPHLARGEISLIAESTPERLARVREELPGFAAHFRAIAVPALDARQTLTALLGVQRELESDSTAGPAPRLSPAALEALLDGAARFRGQEAFPGKAVRLLRRVAAGAGQLDPLENVRRFTVPHVHEVLRAETGLPPFVIGAAPPRSRAEISRDLAAQVAGQPEALEAVTEVVLAMQAGLGDPGKPLATLLLVGPTGVGKTETAKALARYLFGSADRLLRFDMSELTSPHSLGRLFGEAGGHGPGVEGELTTALRTQPLRVILLDEIEKAHPRIFDALLQLLGEGRVTDATGRTADARHAVILMTSNLGVREAAARPGFGSLTLEDSQQHYLAAVRAFFRPELFNRIDRVVPFRALDRPALRVVVEQALGDLLARRGIRHGNVLVDVEPALLDQLVEQAFDPRYGARPLRRALERQLTVTLARHLATRGGEELAVVELYREETGGGVAGMGLSVTLLEEQPVAADPDPPAGWTAARLGPLVRALEGEAGRLASSPPLMRLAEQRRRALAGEGPEPPGADVVESLRAVTEGLAAIDVEDPGGWQFVEEDDGSFTKDQRHIENYVDRNRFRGGLRPRPSYQDVPVIADPEATLRQFRPRLVGLRDELAVVACRMASHDDQQDYTLLLEPLGVADPAALAAAAALGLRKLFTGPTWQEVMEDGVRRWIPDESVPVIRQGWRPRRLALGYQGPGLRALIEPVPGGDVGWVLIRGIADHGHVEVPVRLELVEGLGPEAVAVRDARVAAEKAARRRGESPAAPGACIIARGSLHLASGHLIGEALPIAACRARQALGGHRGGEKV
jgi:ATP-dependent Clp protease ATP-binding subunit ClpC